MRMADSQELIKVTIDLPSKMLIEQLNLTVEGNPGKKQSEFSKHFQLISVLTSTNSSGSSN